MEKFPHMLFLRFDSNKGISGEISISELPYLGPIVYNIEFQLYKIVVSLESTVLAR